MEKSVCVDKSLRNLVFNSLPVFRKRFFHRFADVGLRQSCGERVYRINGAVRQNRICKVGKASFFGNTNCIEGRGLYFAVTVGECAAYAYERTFRQIFLQKRTIKTHESRALRSVGYDYFKRFHAAEAEPFMRKHLGCGMDFSPRKFGKEAALRSVFPIARIVRQQIGHCKNIYTGKGFCKRRPHAGDTVQRYLHVLQFHRLEQ